MKAELGASSERKVLLAVFAAAVLARLVAMAVTWIIGGQDAFAIEDSAQFLREAGNLADAGTLLGIGADGAAVYNPQVMPLAALLFAIPGVSDVDGAWRIVLFQGFVDGATCVVIARTAGYLSPPAMLPAGLVAAFNPTQLVLSNLLLSDTLCLFFYAIMLMGAVRMVRDERAPVGWIAVLMLIGVVGGVYTRFVSLHLSIALVVLVMVAVVWRYRADGLKRIAAIAGVAVLGLALIQPIAWRNHVAFGSYELSSQGGTHLLYWVTPLARDLSGFQPRQDAEDEARERLEAILAARPDADRDAVMTSLGAEMLFETGVFRLTKAWVLGSALNVATPAIAIHPVVRALPHDSFYDTRGFNAVDKVLTFLTAAQNQPYGAIIALAGVSSLIWLGLMALGIVAAGRLDFVVILMLLAWCAAVLAVTGPVVSPKYRMPLEPVFCVFTAIGLLAVLNRSRKTIHAIR